MEYILDTNILLHWIRKQSVLFAFLADLLANNQNHLSISLVSAGEILSLSYQFGWGDKKRNHIDTLLSRLDVLMLDDIEYTHIYAEIDAFSQGKHPHLSLPLGMSARNMGKNDLWIATSTYILGGILLTTDNDFDHLNGIFFEV